MLSKSACVQKWGLAAVAVAALLIAHTAGATNICRKTTTENYGEAIEIHPEPAFMISDSCNSDPLAIRAPVALTIRFKARSMAKAPRKDFRNISPKPLRVYFDLDKHALYKNDRALLNTISPGTRVRITGYTCPLGTARHNLALSIQRADTVKEYLQKRGVVILSAEGRGECCQVSKTDLSLNRRVVIDSIKGGSR